jgi:TatD DNase family protein
MPKYFDIHCHINFKAFKEDGEAVIRRALENDTWLINVGSQYTTSKRAVDIARKYPEGVYACVGLHPIHLEESYHDEEEIDGPGFVSRKEEFDYQKYLAMAKDPKVVAIGECGLDYYHLNSDTIEKQKKVFMEQIKLANEIKKPLMLHIRNPFTSPPNPLSEGKGEADIHPAFRQTQGSSREGNLNAYADVAEILQRYSKVSAVSHCFCGDVEDMKRFIEMGIYISFSGNITYKPRPEIFDSEKVVLETPLDKILTDTDSPYLSPALHRGKRNEPVYVKEVVKKIAEIKNLPEREVARIIVQNVRKLFKI